MARSCDVIQHEIWDFDFGRSQFPVHLRSQWSDPLKSREARYQRQGVRERVAREYDRAIERQLQPLADLHSVAVRFNGQSGESVLTTSRRSRAGDAAAGAIGARSYR